jgi:AcrR family transcriptional regulator
MLAFVLSPHRTRQQNDYHAMGAENLKRSSENPRDRSRRGQGRPSLTSKSVVGRDELIDATLALLREKAPSEIGRLDVARKAGVDPALIRYYFGNMSGLMTEVTTILSRQMHAQMAAAEAAAENSEDRLRNRIAAIVKIMSQTPFLNDLIVEQILYGAKETAKVARQEMVSDSLATLQALVEEGIRTKRFRSLDPKFLHIAIVGMCDFFFTGRPVLDELFGPGQPSSGEYVEFVSNLILEGLRPRS